MNKKTMDVLKWIAILPAAIAAYLLVFAIANIIFTFSGRDADGSYPITSLLAPAIASVIAGFSSIALAAYIAPIHKDTIGLVLLILICCIAAVDIYIMITGKYSFKLLLETIGQPVGAIIGYNKAKEFAWEQSATTRD